MASINPFSPIQEGTGTPSPNNVRPIKPAVSIAGGKNLFEIVSYTEGVTWYRRGYSINPIIDVENDEITLTSVGYGNTQLVRLQNFKPGTYTFSFNMELSGNAENYTPQKRMIIRCYDSNRNRLSSSDVNIVGYTYNQYYLGFYGEPGTFTVPNSVDHFELTVGVGNDTEGNIYKFNNIQLEEGSTATTYEPYQSLDIYGGYLDIGNKQLVNDMVLLTFDGSDDEQWKIEYLALTQTYNFYIPSAYVIPKARTVAQYSEDSTTSASKVKCNQARPRKWMSNGTESYSGGMFYIAASGTININGELFEAITVNDFKSYLSEHPLQIVYEVADPITYSLSSTQLAQVMSQLGIRVSSMMERKKLILLNSPHVETVSGSIASFSTDIKAPLKSVKIEFQPQQEGSGDPSLSNIRYIRGYSGITVNKCGQNMLVPNSGVVDSLGVTWTKNGDGTVDFKGTPTSYSGCQAGTVDITGWTQMVGKIVGGNNNVAFNGMSLYNNSGNKIAAISSGWEMQTPGDSYVTCNLSNYPTATEARVALKRGLYNNAPIEGRCYVIICKTVEDLIREEMNYYFQQNNKNLFNLHVPAAYPRGYATANTTKRIFIPNTVIQGTSGTNYYSCNSASYSINGEELTINTNSGYGVGFAFKLKKSTQYTINATFDNPIGIAINSYSSDGTFTSLGAGIIDPPYTFTTKSDSEIILITFNNQGSSYYDIDIKITNIQLEEGSSATAYQPYIYPIYGGYLDLKTGQLVQTHKKGVFGIDLDGVISSDGLYCIAKVPDMATGDFSTDNKTMCDKAKKVYERIDASSSELTVRFATNVYNNIYIYNLNTVVGITTQNEYDEWIKNNPITCIYPLATPITYQLTPEQIKTFIGENNIWSDGDFISIKYWTH